MQARATFPFEPKRGEEESKAGIKADCMKYMA